MPFPTLTKPRCFLVHALAPAGTKPADANRQFNAFVADRRKPLVVFHDHFIGAPGGVAVFYAETAEHRAAIESTVGLEGWTVEVRPLIYSHSPAALDEQIAYTLRAYRETDWAQLRTEQRPRYGDPARETETGEEDPAV